MNGDVSVLLGPSKVYIETYPGNGIWLSAADALDLMNKLSQKRAVIQQMSVIDSLIRLTKMGECNASVLVGEPSKFVGGVSRSEFANGPLTFVGGVLRVGEVDLLNDRFFLSLIGYKTENRIVIYANMRKEMSDNG